MLRQLKLQERLVAMAAAPILIVAVVAVGLLLFVSSPGTTAYGIFALVGVGASAAAAFVIGKSILASIDELNSSVRGLADAHGRLAAGEIAPDDLQQLPVETEDRLGDLAAAVNAINATTVEARETQRALVKESLSDIVTNLARRSQTLLDRQVEYLDRLESSEEDPDRLGELFKVDHLATRMRRNAESLKVLADADPGRRRGGPVEVADVLRVAMGEVENYEHIELTDVDEGQAEAGAAMDLAHMVAELMENATQFSPPESTVQVSGQFNPAGQFEISISDSGMGMPDQKFAESNAILANPPELGLSMSRSLGFMVIGRLAQRVGATVKLQPNTGSGTVAVVTVPASVFKNQAPAPTAPAKTERPASTPPTTAGSPALEKLLGLAPEKLDGANLGGGRVGAGNVGGGNVGGGTQNPQTDWAVNSPFGRSAAEGQAEEPAEAPAAKTTTPQAEQKPAKSKPAKRRSKAKKQTKQAQESAAETPAADTEAQRSESTTSGAGQPKARQPENKQPENKQPESKPAEIQQNETWTPPEVTADAPARIFPDAPEQLTDAIPSGEAFDTGVESLLDEKRSDDGGRGLAKRQRGASQVPIGQGRAVAASNRNPEEIRSMLSRYRDGLKDGKRTAEDAGGATADQSQADNTNENPNKTPNRNKDK